MIVLVFLLIFGVADGQEVSVYEIRGNSTIVLKSSLPVSLPDNFSFCLFILIDKFGDDGNLNFLLLQQKDNNGRYLSILLGMKLLKSDGDPKIVPTLEVNGEQLETQHPVEVLKDTWNRVCLDMDWKQRYLGEY